MRKPIISVLLLLITLLSHAQQGRIEGRVYNEKNNEPLEFATIQVQGTLIGSTSDLDGKFILTGIDPGFANDGPAWAARNGHALLAMDPEGPGYVARFRKGGAAAPAPLAAAGLPAPATAGKTSFVVFSGDLDKVLAAFIIANGALAMGEQVSMFFTFWGLNTLRRSDPPKRDKPLLDAVFGQIADRADFYGILAAEELGQGFAPPSRKPAVDDDSLRRARTDPGLQRARALLALDMRTEAVREWNWALHGRDDGFLLAAASLALQHGLYDRAISSAEHWWQRVSSRSPTRPGMFPAYTYFNPDPRAIAAARISISGVVFSGSLIR